MSYPSRVSTGVALDPSPVELHAAMHGRRSVTDRAYIIVKRLVFVVVALNVVVLAMLVVVELTPEADAGAEAFADSNDAPPDRPETTVVPDEPPPDGIVEADDAHGAEVQEVSTPDDGAEPVEPATVGSTISTEPPPFPDPFVPTKNEVQPEAKEMGALVAYVMTNYEVDSSLADVLATLPPFDPAHAGAAAVEVQTVYHPEMWSRGTVEYAQLGGHLNGRISIIVVVRQDLGIEGSGEPVRTETRTMEVRLARGESGAWELETVASAGGLPIERPADLSPLAASVVDHERIELPDTGAWDIYAGYIDPAVLQMMLDIAERTPYSVVVLQTGHSYNVFETNRVSNHSVGRAVDIYKLESEVVVDGHDVTSEFYALSEWVVSRTDVKEFGSPWLFPDAVAHTFTNEVHHDHLHIGVFPAPPAEE